MSVTHFIPSGLRMSRRVKLRAISTTLPGNVDRSPVLSVTAGRPHRVGPPTTGRPATADVGPLVTQAVVAGLESLDALERQTREVARDFRWQRVTSARCGLVALVNGTHAMVQLAASAAEAVGEDLDLLSEVDGLSASETTRRAVNRLIRGQMAEDWSDVADTLERGFRAALESWRVVFESIVAPDGGSDPFGHAA